MRVVAVLAGVPDSLVMTHPNSARAFRGSCVSGDGEISEKREYVFTDWDPSATSDLEALRSVFGTNGVEVPVKQGNRTLRPPDVLQLISQRTISILTQGVLPLQVFLRTYFKSRGSTVWRENTRKLALAAIFASLFSSLTGSPAQGSIALRESLQGVLEEMGYENVIIDACGISFEALVEPSDTNNGFFRYFRYIDIGSVAFEAFEVEENIAERRYAGGIYYNYSTLFSDEYFLNDTQTQFSLFDNWARSTYPESNYPYTHAGASDIYSQRIYDDAVRMVESINDLNRLVAYTRFGAVLIVNDVFSFSSLDRDLLEESLNLMSDLSSEYPCSGTRG